MQDGQLSPFAGWGLAGLPVVGTFLQAAFALAGVEARTLPVVGGVVDAFISLQVFREAAIQFKASTAVVLVLFVLIAAAWVGQGVAMGLLRNRDVTFACAGLVSVLFLVLFFGVYSSLFGSGIGVVQLGLFFAVPFVASAGALGGAWLRDWEVDLESAAAEDLSEASDLVARKRETFDAEYRRQVGEDTLDAVAELAPNAVAEARDAAEREREGYDELESKIGNVRSSVADASDGRRRAAELLESAKRRDPDAAVDRIQSDLADGVRTAVERGDVDLTVRSRYGRTYEVVNLQSTFREVRLPPSNEPTHVAEVDRTIGRLLGRDDVDLATVADALGEIRVHQERIERHVSDTEESFHASHEAAETDVERTRDELERLQGAVRDRVEEKLVDGHDPGVDSVHSVEEQLREAREALHDCRFDEAERLVGEARDTADGLLTAVQFFGSLAGALDHGQDRVSLPQAVDPELARDLAPAFESEYGVDYHVEDGHISVDTRGEPVSAAPTADRDRSVGRSTATSSSSSSSRDEYVNPEEYVDEVLLLFDELAAVAEAGSDTVHLETGDLPEYAVQSEALAAIERFCNRQNDLVESFDLPAGAPPGIVDVRFTDRNDAPAALDALYDRFKEQYV
ncbi:hypothetical protein [Haloarchaeobius litoreus]|uniref:Uncharacterized protein n=1 Tax=Haloarchaeobius litoreus TaxID=755306 RepID=A0ABD6DLY9_9EURY|nr:hypothetical protein [Haloarchaeobius litoreus]